MSPDGKTVFSSYSAPVRIVEDTFADVRSAFTRFALVMFAKLTSAPVKIAESRLAFPSWLLTSMAESRLALSSVALIRIAPFRFALLRSVFVSTADWRSSVGCETPLQVTVPHFVYFGETAPPDDASNLVVRSE